MMSRPINSETFNLVILEDDPAERQLLAVLILARFASWNIGFVTDAAELLALLTRTAGTPRQASVLLLDLGGIDGTAVLRQVRSLPGLARLPVVGFSSYSSQTEIDAFLSAGASAYFDRPLDMRSITGWLNRLPALACKHQG